MLGLLLSTPHIVVVLLAAAVTRTKKSPWSAQEWTLTLNIGREPGTYMPESWAASGGRLQFSVEVLIDSESTTESNNDNFLGSTSNTYQLSVLEPSTFISNQGTETIFFNENTGAWKLSFRRSEKKGDASKLRLYLDAIANNKDDDDNIAVAARRNDVTLPAERLYLVANCWRQSEELQRGLQRFIPIQQDMEQTQRVLDQQLSHETGDRRLDGKNLVDTVKGSIDMAMLVQRRDEAYQSYQQALKVLPSPDIVRTAVAGHWPGTDDPLVIAPGTVGVKRKSSTFPITDEYHIIGTWTAKPSYAWEEVDE